MWDFVPKGGDTFLFHFWKVYGGRKKDLLSIYRKTGGTKNESREKGEMEKQK